MTYAIDLIRDRLGVSFIHDLKNDFSQDSEEDDLPLDKIISNASNPQSIPQEIAPIDPTDNGAGSPNSSNNESSKALPGEQYFM